MKKIALLTSGGDAPGMNAAIRAVVITAHHYRYQVLGFYHGYNGLLKNQFTTLNCEDVNGIIQRGGTILKSARCKEMHTEQGIRQAINTLKENEVDALIVIGGDGSFNGLIEINKRWHGQIIGIPGTIDNDVDETDFTIGFSTAVNTAINAIDKIRDTADAFERVFIVELMGRHSGHITFNVGIATAAEKILSFENTNCQDEQAFLKELADDIKTVQSNRHASYIIVIAENLWPSGTSELAKSLSETTGIDCTPCILGYIQRGGSPVAKDRILATKLGVGAVRAIAGNETNLMIGEQNNSVVHIPLIDAVNHFKQVSKNLVKAQTDILALSSQTQI